MRRAALLFLLLALWLLPTPSAVAHDVPAEQGFGAASRDFEQRHLDIHVRPDIAAGAIAGRVSVRFEAGRDEFRVLRLHAVEMQIHAVRDGDGHYLAKRHEDGVLHITLNRALEKGEESIVTVEYSAHPKRGLYFHAPSEAYPDRPLMLYSQGQGTDNRRWIPCYDAPDARCSFDLHVTVPQDLQSLSNGELVEQEALPGGERRDHWQFQDRAPSYLITLVVGDFDKHVEEWHDVRLEYLAPQGHGQHLRQSLGRTPAILDFFSDYTGLAYPWSKYAQVYVWDFIYGGMENVTATTLNMRALHPRDAMPDYRADGLVAHEAAHMWFGDLLTCRTWPHMWLNEGFATYFTDLFFEHHYGTEEFLVRRRDQNRRYLEGTPEPHKLKLERDKRGDQPLELGGYKAYNRGAAILHMLRRELGDKTFRLGVAAWVKRHKDEAVVSEQLRRVMEEAAGRDLHWFFDQWVYGAGYPVLEARVERDAQGAGPGTLVIRQTQPREGAQGLFRMTLAVRLGARGPLHHLRVYREEHRFPLASLLAPGGQQAVTPTGAYIGLDIGGDLLARVHVEQGVEAWAAMLARAPELTARLDALEALESFGPAALPALGKALAEDKSWAVRRDAAHVLGRMGGAPAHLALLPASQDTDSRVRVAVAEALGQTNRRLAGKTLVRMAGGDASPYVRGAAARSIGKLKLPDSRGLLTLLLKVESHGDIVRQGAIVGLRDLGDPAALPLVLPYLDYGWGKGANHVLRQAALDAALKLGGDEEAVHERVVALLADPYHRMRQWAATACGVHGIREAIPQLKKLRIEDWNGSVRGEAFRALVALGIEKDPTR